MVHIYDTWYGTQICYTICHIQGELVHKKYPLLTYLISLSSVQLLLQGISMYIFHRLFPYSATNVLALKCIECK